MRPRWKPHLTLIKIRMSDFVKENTKESMRVGNGNWLKRKEWKSIES